MNRQKLKEHTRYVIQIGNGMPYNGHVATYNFEPGVTRSHMKKELMTQAKELIDAILDDSEEGER